MCEENDPDLQLPNSLPPAAHGARESSGIPGLDAEALFAFGLQSAGLQAETRPTHALAFVALARVTAVLAVQGPDGITTRTPISEESVWLVPAGVRFSVHWHEPVVLLRIGLTNEMIAAELGGGAVPHRVVRLAEIVRMDWPIAQIVGDIRASLQEGEAPSLTELRAVELGTRLLRAMQGSAAIYRAAGLSDDRFHAVADFIETNLTQKLSRGFLAKSDGQSLHHFARMFKARTGLTPRQYVDRRRCFRARELIQSGRRLADAAMEVGFFDQPEMCRKFNAVFGCPPGTFSPRTPP